MLISSDAFLEIFSYGTEEQCLGYRLDDRCSNDDRGWELSLRHST